MCVDGEPVVDHSDWCVLDDGVGKGVVKSSPVCESVGPSVRAHEVLSVYRCGDVRENCLYVAFHCVLPLLVGGGTLVTALVVFVKLVCFG